MTSGSTSAIVDGSGTIGRDLAWKHCIQMWGRSNRNDTICNYYNVLIKSEDITRFKFHLLHT